MLIGNRQRASSPLAIYPYKYRRIIIKKLFCLVIKYYLKKESGQDSVFWLCDNNTVLFICLPRDDQSLLKLLLDLLLKPGVVNLFHFTLQEKYKFRQKNFVCLFACKQSILNFDFISIKYTNYY